MLIGLADVSVAYPGTLALDRVSLEVNAGDVLAVVGANGSGKTTLLTTLCGMRGPSTGALVTDDGPVIFRRPADALAKGIALVPQEPQLAETLTVWENLLIGTIGLLGAAPSRPLRQAARARIRSALPHVDPDTEAGTLRKADRAVLGLLRALHRSPAVLALDEPTAVLGENSIEVVAAAAAQVQAAGGAIVLVSHRLRDIVQLATRVAVLVDGKLVHDSPIAGVSVEDLVDRIAAGRGATQQLSKSSSPPPASPAVPSSGDNSRVVISGMQTGSGLSVDDLTINPGDILGIAGLAGAGRSRHCRAVSGHEKYRGEITVGGLPAPADPRASRRMGIAYVPEDRVREGLFPSLSVERNLEVGDLVGRSLAAPTAARPSRSATRQLIDRFGIRTASSDASITSLSGGNQQRVVLARVLGHRPRLLVVDEPTQGVDRAGRAAIHTMIRDFAESGGAVLLVSSEFEELQALATRLVVMVDGNIVAHRLPDTPYRELVALATGAQIAAIAPDPAAEPGASS